MEKLLWCWGKTNPDNPGEYHPAVYHMLDVGNVARVLLSEPASPRWRKVLGKAFNTSNTNLSGWVSGLAAFHDIGKISAEFQVKSQIHAARLEGSGFCLHPCHGFAHNSVGQATILDLFRGGGRVLSPALLKTVSAMVGGHHGEFLRSDDVERVMQFLTARMASTAAGNL
jgi:CRISPR-associated endonuclease/helicase Cas3